MSQVKFETINGQLCRMVEPEPLTPESQFPCVVRLIQDDSPMGKYNQSYSEYRYGVAFGFGYCMLPIIATQIAKNGVVKNVEWDVNRYEIIGYPVEDGSNYWAWYQASIGNMVYRKQLGRVFHMNTCGYVVANNGEFTYNYDQFLMIEHANDWQLYTEPEPQPAKEPIANCDNCKHICTNSNIDHCHMYEPRPAYAVGDWVSDGVTQGRITYIEDGIIDVTGNNGNIYTIEKCNLRKLDHSEVVVDFGNGIFGTIEPSLHPTWINVRKKSDWNTIASIYVPNLDEPIQTLVKELLEKQKEEK